MSYPVVALLPIQVVLSLKQTLYISLHCNSVEKYTGSVNFVLTSVSFSSLIFLAWFLMK